MVNRRSLALIALLAGSTAWRWHPVHAARVEVIATGESIVATVRVYRDDFPPGIKPQPVTDYLARTLQLTDGGGHTVSLQVAAIAVDGDRLRITLTGRSPVSLAKGRLGVTMLQERYNDQVNVAEARIDGRRAQLVFLKGDTPQALP